MIYIVLFTFLLLYLTSESVSTPYILDQYQQGSLTTFHDDTGKRSEIVNIICTVDGNMHGLDRFGRKMWTSSSGETMLSARNYAGTISSQHSSHQLGQRKSYAVLPSIDGSLIYSSLEGMRKTKLTTRMLVEQSPFISTEGVSFSATTRTRMVSLDARNGQFLFDSDRKLKTFSKLEGAVPVWFGRVDYFVRAVDTLSGQEEFNISFSEMHPIPYNPLYEAQLEMERNYAPNLLGSASQEREGANVVGLLARHSNADSLYEASYAQWAEEFDDLVDAADLGLYGEARGSASAAGLLRGRSLGKGGTRGRRRRKNRRRMEQRGGELQQLRERMLMAAGAVLDVDSMMLISTPEGELYFSDLQGIVVEKVPVSLHSPVIQAFNLQRAPPSSLSVDEAPITPSWSVRSINVHHRMVTHSTAGDFNRNSPAIPSATALAPLGEYIEDRREVDKDTGATVVVQAPSAADGSLYALEVTELDLSATHTPMVGTQQQRLAGADPVKYLGSPQDNTGTHLQVGIGRTMPISRYAAATAVTKPALRQLVRMSTLRPPSAHSGSSSSYGSHIVDVEEIIDPNQAAARLPTITDLPPDEDESDAQSTALIEEDCWEGKSRVSCTADDSTAVFLAKLRGEEDSDALTLAVAMVDESSSASLSVRGPHRLRSDLYDGVLFHPDERLNFFRGVLSSQHPSASAAGVGRLDSSDRADADFTQRDAEAPPVHLDTSLRSKLTIFAYKVSETVQQWLVYLASVVVIVALVLAGGVVLLRGNASFAHVLAPDEALPTQVAALASLLIHRVLETLLPSTPTTVLHAALPAEIAREREKLEHSRQADRALHSAQGVVVEALSLQVPDPAVIVTSAPVSTASVPAASNTPPSAVQERVDAEGRRVLQVGSLLVLPDQVLGYGSHGTVVYKGSLHGRPLAVKRVLSQFVKSADREIALLMRSDGHPNVVRYYTKEEHSDFVYLGLQLCEMTLKDYVAQARIAASAKTVAVAEVVVITEGLKSSLRQIAEGLAHLHAQKIVHRDIKPHNILCCAITADIPSTSAPSPAAAASSQDTITEPPTQQADLSSFVLKISDMGLSKQLDRDHHSFSSLSLSLAAGRSVSMSTNALLGVAAANGSACANTAAAVDAAVGTVGWQAPELIRHRYTVLDKMPAASLDAGSTALATPREGSDSGMTTVSGIVATGDSDVDDPVETPVQEGLSDGIACDKQPINQQQAQQHRRALKKRTLTVDVFSLGCVFYFTLTLGEHPFGEWFEREANIAAGRADLRQVQHDVPAVDLLTWMLHSDPLQRPSSREVCAHVFFWTAAQRVDFLVEFSDRLEQEPMDSTLVQALEAGAREVTGSRWDIRLDALLLSDLGKFRKYDCSSVRDLLRVVRNKRHHFHELSPELKVAMGTVPSGFLSYFDSRFPALLLHCAAVANEHLRGEALFQQWVGSTSPTAHSRLRQPNPSPFCVPITTGPVFGSSNSDIIAVPSSLLSDAVASGSCGEIMWENTSLSDALNCVGWWHSADLWVQQGSVSIGGLNGKRMRPSHIVKALEDAKYRTRLCSQWEESGGAVCSMRKKGKCIFAHGPLELRAKESRRSKWGRAQATGTAGEVDLMFSGGENALGEARLLEIGRTAGSRPGAATGSAAGPKASVSRQFTAADVATSTIAAVGQYSQQQQHFPQHHYQQQQLQHQQSYHEPQHHHQQQYTPQYAWPPQQQHPQWQHQPQHDSQDRFAAYEYSDFSYSSPNHPG